MFRTRFIISLVFLFLIWGGLEQGALAAEPKLEEELVEEFDFEPGGWLDLENEIGPVEISVWDQNKIRIQAVKKVRKISDPDEARMLLDTLKIRIKKTGDTVEIKTVFPQKMDMDRKDGWFKILSNLFRFPPSVDSETLPLEVCYRIKLPRRSNVSLDTEIGKIAVSGLEGTVKAESEIGSVNISKITGELEVESQIGEINIERIIGPVKARTEIGKISLGVDPQVSADLDVSTDLGWIDLDHTLGVEGKLSKKHIRGRIGAGGPLIEIKTEIGKVNITASRVPFPGNSEKESSENEDNSTFGKDTEQGTIRDVWRNRFTLGAMLSQKRDNFSKWDMILGFEGNAMWRKTGKSRIHSFFKLGLTRVPQEIEIALDQEVMDKFILSRRTLKTDLGWYWVRDFRVGENDILSLGPIVDFGLESYSSQNAVVGEGYTLDIGAKNNFYYGGGLRFSQHERSWHEENPEILRTVDLLFSRYSQFFLKGAIGNGVIGTESRDRMIIDAYSKWFGSLYLGFTANFPIDFEVNDVEGDPDLRMWLAFRW